MSWPRSDTLIAKRDDTAYIYPDDPEIKRGVVLTYRSNDTEFRYTITRRYKLRNGQVRVWLRKVEA